MASHLGRTVQEAQATLTSTEFIKWVSFLNWKDTEEFRREDHYMAQIAAEVERTRVKNPGRVSADKKMIEFKLIKPEEKDPEDAMEASKSFWLGTTGATARKLPAKVKQPKRGASEDGSQ